MQWLHPHLFFLGAGRGRGRRGTVERWVRVILYVQKRKTKTNRNTSLIISYQILHRLKYAYTITPARWEGRDSAFLRLTPVTQSCSARSEGRNSGWVLWDVRSPPEQVGWLVGYLHNSRGIRCDSQHSWAASSHTFPSTLCHTAHSHRNLFPENRNRN